jgi:hypothetical protein
LVALGPLAYAGDITVTNFGGGLNTQDTPAEIDPSMAQDLLNIQIQPGGASIYKRDGYGLFQTLGSTQAVHGGYHFQQVGGNDVQLWGSSTTLFSSVNDAAFVKVGTGTLAATWQCADSQGSAYCLSSSRDTAIKTDGSVANTTYQSAIPLGTMLTFTPLQLVVAGVSGNESTIYVSGQNAFTNFTIGVLPSSPFTEPIASPGSRITHLAYYFGKLFWWKDQSFGYATFTNQNDWQLTIVSNQIGTLDNSDAFWNSSGFDSGTKFSGTAQANAIKSPGGIFFRGQDNHFYVYDGYYLTRISRPITPTATGASRRKANSWTQSSQSDFQTGISSPSTGLSYTVSPGNVIVSSFQAVENSSTQWTSGSTNQTTIFPSSFTLSASTITAGNTNILNNGFESGSSNWTLTSGAVSGAITGVNCTLNPRTGSGLYGYSGLFSPGATFEVSLRTCSAGTALNTATFTQVNSSCTYTTRTLSVSGATVGQSVKIRICNTTDNPACDLADYSQCFVNSGTNITFYTASDQTRTAFPQLYAVVLDDITNGRSVTTGAFTSQVYNTGLATATYSISQLNWVTAGSTPTFALQTSTASTGAFSSILTSSGTSAVGNQFVRYASTISIGAADTSLVYFSSITMLARSTGTYFSAVDNAPNLSSWGSFGVTDAVTGISSITYFTRASTGAFTVLSSSPVWVLQTKNSMVTASTGTYMQARADFYLSAATETPTMNDFSFNWFEGTAADKAYITYFNDAIWFSVSAGTAASTNNRIFYWDLLNGAWLVFDIPANGFQIENNSLYFGSPTIDSIFKYGNVITDNAAAINSYWRSKAFLGADPFVQNEFTQADFVLGESSTTLTYTYTLDSKTSTAYVITAYDSAASLIQRDFLLPVGKIGKYYDFKISDNSSNPAWRLMGHRVRYVPLNWNPVLK